MSYKLIPPKDDYELTEEYEELYFDWLDMGGCYCNTGCAPCGFCTHEGNPLSLNENLEAWQDSNTLRREVRKVVENMPTEKDGE